MLNILEFLGLNCNVVAMSSTQKQSIISFSSNSSKYMSLKLTPKPMLNSYVIDCIIM